MRKKWLKRFLGTVLCAVLFVSEIGVSSFAVEEGNSEIEVEDEEAGEDSVKINAVSAKSMSQETVEPEEEQSESQEETIEDDTEAGQPEEEPPSVIVEKLDDPTQLDSIPEEESDEEESEEPMMMAAASVSNADAFVNAFSDISDGEEVEIELKSNVTVTTPITIRASDVTISITGNYTITGNTSRGYLFGISSDKVTFKLDGVTINKQGFYVNTGSHTLNLEGSNGAAITNAAPAVNANRYSTDYADVVISGINFTGNTGLSFSVSTTFDTSGDLETTTDIHGGAIVINNGELTIDNCKFSGNTANFLGGAIFSHSADTTIKNSVFENNEAAVGGCVYISAGNKLNIDRTTFRNNRANNSRYRGGRTTPEGNGAAITTPNAETTITNSEFTGNTGYRGGAIYFSAIKDTTDTPFTISDTIITGNTATWGGFLYSNNDVSMINCTATGNRASYTGSGTGYNAGGVVFINTGSLYMTGGSYTQNTTAAGTSGSYSGGGVIRGGTSAREIVIDGGTYTKNSSGDDGGVIEVRYASSNLIIKGGAKFVENNAVNSGGVIFTRGGNVEISGSVWFEKNNAGRGGAVYMAKNNASPELVVEAGTFIDNKAVDNTARGTRYSNAVGNGGAVYSESGSVNLKNTKVQSNTAANSGGGIYADAAAVEIASDTDVSGNSAAGNDGTAGGGGVYVNTGTVLLNDGTLYKNTTRGSGGGIAAYSGSIVMSGGDVYSNTAEGNGGGGVAVYSGTFTMKGGTIGGAADKANNALTSGSSSGGTMGNGGGVFIIYGKMETSGGVISHNAAVNGGGIYFNGQLNDSRAVFDIEGIEVSDNTAFSSGGGIYANVRNENDKINNIVVENNESSVYGGGIHLNVGNIDVSNTWENITIDNNKSDRGAGISIQGDGSLSMNGGTVKNNIASTAGGGIYTYLELALTDMQIFDNKAVETHGGGIVANGTTSEVTINGGAVEANSAGQYGGGVYIFEKATVTMKNQAKILKNTAGGHGGGIYLATGTLNITGAEKKIIQINENISGSSGGGIYVRNGALDMSYAQIHKNEAKTGDGGGVYLLLADSDAAAASQPSGSKGMIQIALETAGLKAKAANSNIIQAIDNNQIIENEAGGSGGGIYIHIKEGAVSESIVGNTVDGNTAGADGGGAYVNYNGTGKSILNNKFTNNTATGNGGGMYITGTGADTETTNRMALTNDEVSGNSAANGGGIYLDNSKLVLLNAYDKYGSTPYPEKGPTITDNTATSNGGGIYVAGQSDLEIWSNTTISENKADMATGYGGGIYLYNQSTLSFVEPKSDKLKAEFDSGKLTYYTRITENEASNGGGLYGIGSGTTVILNTIITGNTATNDGGGIWLMRERLTALKLNNVIFVYDGMQNHADYYQEDVPVPTDVTVHKANISLTENYAKISAPDTSKAENQNKTTSNYTYNNYDIRYHAGTFDVVFNANGGLINIGQLDTYSDNYASTYYDVDNNPEQPLRQEDQNIEADKNGASFLGWFSRAVPNNHEKNLTDYKDDKVDLKKVQVSETTEYYAGWLFAPTIDEIYESGVYGADNNTLTGNANPGAIVKVKIKDGDNEEEYKADNNDDGTWKLDIKDIELNANSKIEAYQYYENYEDDDGDTIESPTVQGKVLAGYKIVYKSGDDEEKTHKVDGNTKFMASYKTSIYGGNTFKRSGYQLAGWSLESGASSVAYEFDDELLISNMLENESVADNTITFYAVWKEENYTVTYKPGEVEPGTAAKVTVPVDNSSYFIGGRAEILSPEKTIYNGYYFTGWLVEGTEKDIRQPGNLYSFTETNAKDITLVAQWESSSELEIIKTTSEKTVDVGDFVHYEIAITNTGRGSWSGILTDELPVILGIYADDNDVQMLLNDEKQDLTVYGFMYAYDENGTPYARIGNEQNIVMAPGDQIVISFKAYVRSSAKDGEKFKNYVVASGTDTGGNSVSAEAESGETTVVYQHSGINISKTAEPAGTVRIGDTISYTITVNNSGGAWFGNVTDILTDGLIYENDTLDINTSTGVSYEIINEFDPDELNIQINELGEGQQMTIQFDAVVQTSAAGKTIENMAAATGEDRSGTTDNDDDSHSNPVEGFRVKYHAENNAVEGTAPVDANSYRHNEKVTVKDDNGMEYDGYYFAGWSTERGYTPENPSGQFYRPDAVFHITEDINLYAVFYKEPTVDVELYKRDYDDKQKLLDGAEFLLLKLPESVEDNAAAWETADEIGRYVSGENGAAGYVKFGGLTEGTYRGYETTPPEGYQYPIGNSNYITVFVEADINSKTGVKTLSVSFPSIYDAVTNPNGWVKSITVDEQGVLTAYNQKVDENEPVARLVLTKVDEAGDNIEPLSGETADAQFTLYKKVKNENSGEEEWGLVGGSHIAQPDTNLEEEIKVFSWNTLTEGEYLIRETRVPATYMLASEEAIEFALVKENANSLKMVTEDELPLGVEQIGEESLFRSISTDRAKVYAFQMTNVHGVDIEKTADTTKAYVGDEFTYEIKMTNYSNELAWGGTFTDILPDGLEYVSHEVLDEDDNDDDILVKVGSDKRTINIEFSPLDEGETAFVRVTVKALKSGSYMNTVAGHIETEKGYQADLDAEAEEVIVDKLPELEKYLSDPAQKDINVGDTISYTLKVTNSGNTTWTGTLVDEMPDGIEYVKDSIVSSPDDRVIEVQATARHLTLYIKELAPGDEITITFDGCAVKTGNYINSIHGTFRDEEEKERDVTNDAEEVEIDNIPSITKKVDKTEVTVEDSLTYTIKVVNDGIKTWDLVLTDELEAGLLYQSYEIVSGKNIEITEKDGIVTILINQMVPDTSAEIKLYVLAETAGYYTNVIGGTKTDENGDTFDLDDAVSEETHVKDPEKSTPPPIDDIYEGDREVSGTGEPDSEIVVTFPDGSKEEARVDEDGKWTVSVPDDVELKVGDKVTAIQTEPDKLPSDETIAPVKPIPGEDISITKSVDQTEVMVGDELTYTVRVENKGLETWNLILTDVIENGLLYQGYEIVSGENIVVTERNGSILLRIEKLGPDTFVEIAIHVKTETAGDYTNVITGIKIDDKGDLFDLDNAESEKTFVKDPDKSVAPPIDDIYEGDREVSGEGIPGSEIVVTFPDGSQEETIVDENGKWKVPVPGGVDLKEGDEVTAVQTEPGKLPSEVTVEPVQPLVPTEPQKPEKSRPPVFDDIYEGDTVVKGDGIPGSTVIITFPDGTQIDTRVDENGRWSVEVPEGIYLKTGEILSGVQIEPGKLASDKAEETVKPLKKEDEEKESGGKKNNSDNKKSAKKSLRTGDNAPVVVFLGAALLAAAIFLLLNTYRKRQK